MAGEMLVRNLAQRTIDTYTYHVERFAKHFGQPLDQLGPEEIRLYQLHRIEVRHASWSSFNQAVCGLRFLYHVTLPRPWVVQHILLFPGKTPNVPLSSATIQKACKLAAALARINNPVTPHTLRHSYATGLLQAGVDLLTIGRLLGHKSFTTTMIYLHVRRPHLESTPSPLDWLPVRQCPRWVDPHQAPSPSKPANNASPPNSNPAGPDQPPSDPANRSA
jgi:site-specific recombinase XerD